MTLKDYYTKEEFKRFEAVMTNGTIDFNDYVRISNEIACERRDEEAEALNYYRNMKGVNND